MPTVACGFENQPCRLVGQGPTLFVTIGYDPNYRSDNGRSPELPTYPRRALVDTGANCDLH